MGALKTLASLISIPVPAVSTETDADDVVDVRDSLSLGLGGVRITAASVSQESAVKICAEITKS